MQPALNNPTTYPIAEIFTSPQGEGRHTGVLMNFVRFAGCTVGKPMPKDLADSFPIYTTQCTTYDGRKFPCDTDYRKKMRMTAEEIIENCRMDVMHFCLTGGEPLMHDLYPFLLAIKRRGHYQIHVETSGTIPVDRNKPLWNYLDWICCSPKEGFIDAYADLSIAHEFKLLVDEEFDWDKIPDSIKRKSKKISLSAINDEKSISQENSKRAVLLQLEHPEVRLSMQSHKIWGVR